jgi:hypothetical protein
MGGDSPLRAVSEVTKPNYIEILRSQIILKFFYRWSRLRFRVYEFVYIYIYNFQCNFVCNLTLNISENCFGSGRGFSFP